MNSWTKLNVDDEIDAVVFFFTKFISVLINIRLRDECESGSNRGKR